MTDLNCIFVKLASSNEAVTSMDTDFVASACTSLLPSHAVLGKLLVLFRLSILSYGSDNV